jgi:hypothetical protein
MDWMGLQFSTISTNINKKFPFYWLRPFANYFLLNISPRYATFHLAYTGSLMTATSNPASGFSRLTLLLIFQKQR